MNGRMRIDFDDLMRHLMMVGFFGLVAWTMVSAYGILMGILAMAHVSGLALYAVVGAAVLGLGWTASSLLGGQRSSTPR